MLTCPKCHAGVPEGMRFCLQCGVSLATTPPPAAAPVAPRAPYAAPAPPAFVTAPPQTESPTVPLKIAPTPVLAPRPGGAAVYARPSLDDQTEEVDDEALKRSFLRPVTQSGAVLCRFCKGPLDLDGDFCEQCGAPVTEAAPPGMIKPKPQPVAPPARPAPPPSKPAQAAPTVRPPVASAPTHHSTPTPPPPAMPAAPARTPAPFPPAMPASFGEPTHPMPEHTPAPAAPTSPPAPPAEERPSGLMGRLKGLFKKG